MSTIAKESIAQLFTDARTHNEWLQKPVSDETLRELYDLVKWGPTSANTTPARIVFVKSAEAKAKLLECMAPGNVEKTRNAPVTAIIAFDLKFYEHLPKLFPNGAEKMVPMFSGDAAKAAGAAHMNSSLQGGYFILAARALGLDCGPMAGFDGQKVNDTFFAGTDWRVNFICNLGYGDHAKLFPRNPRLSFDEAARII
ncbi:malonic semialdehyde reductase [Pandoraea pneumonica]|uniref:malonic semialdehyde reductase n=1 Tax=Pandoraea pneumonica TaxID=2508299 RepID=UPI003CF0525C